MSHEHNIFNMSRPQRDAMCAMKDSIIVPLLEGLEIADPVCYHALLMPCLHGPELRVLRARGVPDGNLWALEKDPRVWAEMRRALPVRMLSGPMHSAASMPHVCAEMARTGKRFDLVYLDYFGQPADEHLKALTFLFKLRMLAERADLILTFAANRCARHVTSVNRQLRGEMLGHLVKAYVDAALCAATAAAGCGSAQPRYRSFDCDIYPGGTGRNLYATCHCAFGPRGAEA